MPVAAGVGFSTSMACAMARYVGEVGDLGPFGKIMRRVEARPVYII